jgi:hypothetical protein
MGPFVVIIGARVKFREIWQNHFGKTRQKFAESLLCFSYIQKKADGCQKEN